MFGEFFSAHVIDSCVSAKRSTKSERPEYPEPLTLNWGKDEAINVTAVGDHFHLLGEKNVFQGARLRGQTSL